jgi:hypothetical protein
MKKVNLTLIFSVLLMLLTSDLLAQKHEFLANGNFEGNVSFVDGRPKPEFWKHRSSAGIDNSVNDGIPVLISNSKQGASQGYVYDSLPDCPYDTRHCQGTKNIFDEATTASIRVPLSTYEDSASVVSSM